MSEKKRIHRKVHGDGKRSTLPQELQGCEMVTYEYDPEKDEWIVEQTI